MENVTFKKAFLSGAKLCALGLLIGTLGGLVGALFSHLLSFVTVTREAIPWLLLLLPLGGVATVFLYRAFHMSDYGGTNEIIKGLVNKVPIKPIAAPLIFVSTAITHLFGGSAGREGAAIQLGGAGASALSNVLRLKDTERTVFIMSGMSAVFAGVFGTPLTAVFFILEFKSTKKDLSLAFLPCILSAVIAQNVSSLMGVVGETASLSNVPAFSFLSVAKIVVLAIALSLLGKTMCFIFHKAESFAKKIISSAFLRTVLGSVIVVGLTAIVGDMRYNGSGMSMAMSAVEGTADWFDFILKIVFTALTLAAGFKGGEIVPSFCIGATFGCVLGNILGLDAGFCAALGLVGLFCCAANSPASAVFLGIELFGVSNLPYYLLISFILWPLSVGHGLFDNRLFKPLLLWKKEISDS